MSSGGAKAAELAPQKASAILQGVDQLLGARGIELLSLRERHQPPSLIEAARPLGRELELMGDEFAEQRLGPKKRLAVSYLFEIGHVTVPAVSV